MRASVGAAWRIAAAVAFAATAALAVTLSRGAPMHASLISASNSSTAARNTVAGARHAHRGLPQCALSRLDVSIADIKATARIVASHDHVYLIGFPVEFTNVSHTTCTLSGYPAVSAYLASGAQVGNAASLDTSVTARRIVLAPGASAHAAVVDNASAGRCRVVAAIGLRITPPGQSVPRYIRHTVTACSSSGRAAPVFLHVRALQPGTGVPARVSTSHPGWSHPAKHRTHGQPA
jgi:hypothetical protein